MNRIIKLIIASSALLFSHIGFAHNISESACAAKELRQLGFIHQNVETKASKQQALAAARDKLYKTTSFKHYPTWAIVFDQKHGWVARHSLCQLDKQGGGLIFISDTEGKVLKSTHDD